MVAHIGQVSLIAGDEFLHGHSAAAAAQRSRRVQPAVTAGGLPGVRAKSPLECIKVVDSHMNSGAS